MESSLPAVDIIIVNYNGIGFIEACLESLLQTEYPSFNVILVDNGSSDGSVELVKRKYPGVQIILNNANLGFGKANAIGINSGRADFIALLNNDTVVDKGWLSPLVGAMLEDGSLASACSKLLFMDNRRVINGVGGGMNFLGYGFDIGIYENDDGAYEEVREVFFPCAAACLLRRSAYEDVGGFDPKFFMYHEDVDLGWRFWLKGYRVKCIPRSFVYHAFGGTSLRAGSMEFRNNLGLRHAMRSLIKNYERGTLLKVLPLFISLGIRTTIKHRTWGFLRCVSWNLMMLPDTLSERRRIQRERTVSDRAISSLMWQKIHLPVNYPDYEWSTFRSFAAQGLKRGFVDMSDDRGKNLGYGWHGPEIFFGDGRTKYRWTKAEAVYYLWNKYGDGFVSMEILGLAGVVKRPRKIRVTVNDGQAHEFIVQSDGWESIQVPYNGPSGPLEVRIKAEDTWVPDELLGNGDTRQLGVGMKRAQYVADTGGALPIEGVSVVIPTYNRIKTLLQTLRALENQSLPSEKFEVIVVDDGSTDSTEAEVKSFMGRTSMAIGYFKQANKKQGAARNLGIQHSQMPLLVFIGDDTIPSLHFLEEHLAYHSRKNRFGNVVVIGYTQWPEDIRVTPFMRFIGEYGYQFGYSLIEGEGPLPFNFFYTSNISVLKTFLDELECIFEEDFTTYGWEDIELGYRLERLGMELYYNRNAVTYHYHPVGISSFCLRQHNVGRASRIFLEKHPELGWFLGDPAYLKKIAALSIPVSGLEKVLNFMDREFLISFPRIVYDIILKTSYARGAIEAKE